MRIYALLFGILLTTGYGAAAELAVTALDSGRQTRGDPAAVLPATGAPGGLWDGRGLDPITVESSRDAHAAAPARIISRPTLRCRGADPSTFPTISCGAD